MIREVTILSRAITIPFSSAILIPNKNGDKVNIQHQLSQQMGK